MFLTIDNVKTLASLAIGAGAAKLTTNIIVDKTELEDDAIRVQIASTSVGMMTANSTRGLSDQMIDKAHAWHIARKNRKTEDQ